MKEKIWIYIIEKELSDTELKNLLSDCEQFVKQWQSHEMPVQASVEMYKNRLLIFRNNEEYNSIGGCATDKLFRFIQELEKKYQTNLLNRKLVVFEKDNKLEIRNVKEVNNLIQSGEIKDNTIIYNTAIISSDDWAEFKKPAKDSWLSMVMSTQV